MAHIEPFTAIRYTSSEVSNLIAPPYDVLTADDKRVLLDKDEHNIVAIDLPHVPPKTAGPDNVYERAAGELTSWLDIRALARDPTPALYVYHQTYKTVGKALTRKMFFCRLKLEPFGAGSVFAHEQTFGGPKEDRLKLTVTTRCNLSPIFGLYSDPSNEVSSMLHDAVEREPDQSGMLEGVQNRLWVVDDEELITSVQQKMQEKPIFIADGHHRYGTALMFRDREVQEYGQSDPHSPVHFVLAVLCSMEDPGATIQPYFRCVTEVPRLSAEKLQAALSAQFSWTATSKPASAEELARKLTAVGPLALALYFGAEKACAIVNPNNPELLKEFEPKRHAAWRGLSYSIFHRYIVDEVLTPGFCGGEAPTIHYHKNMQEAIADAMQSGGVAVLMPAVNMGQLREVCLAGELMPQKSTYFHPKLATGLVINPLY